jgi:transcriptional repressor NrdR
MRCPYCAADEDKVVDSRPAEDGSSVRRRRECLACGRRFTTHERVDELPLVVLKRSGRVEPFDRAKLAGGIAQAAANRPIDPAAIEELAAAIEEDARASRPEVSSDRIGLAVLERLRTLDDVAYLRFASVYKGFESASDFQREVTELRKTTAPKGPSGTPERPA